MQIRTFPLGPLQTNCYLISGNGRALVIDPGGDPAPLLALLESEGLTLANILNTHLHFDHILGNAALSAATGAAILASQADEFLLSSEVGGGGFMGLPTVERFAFQAIAPGDTSLLDLPCRILATPGHSPGSLSFYFPDLRTVFVGDLIFFRSVGRTDFPGGDFETLQQSVMNQIFTLPPEVAILAGHGPQSTVANEKMHNPFFSQFQC